jgi:phosphoenolpyruvate-protein kinase (PTS system EI component)
MIEVPSAVAVADQLAEAADFFSIGTNDLAQYVMAADRGNPGVATLPDPFHPAVLRMIKQTVDAARQGGIPVGMCGAFAGLPEAAGLLVGLGLDELSMNAPMIPAQKAAIRELSVEKARGLAARALALTSADEVRELLKSQLKSL